MTTDTIITKKTILNRLPIKKETKHPAKLKQAPRRKKHKSHIKKETLVDRIIDKIFELKKHHFLLLLIFILGFVLRLIAAINISVAADDMHFVTHAINFFGSGRLVTTYDQSSGLWFAFTDMMYKIFGLTQLGSRFASVLFGSLSIFVMYLFTKDFFNKKIALISAFLLAIAPFHIKNTLAEMDVMAMFFVLTGMLLFTRALKTGKAKLFAFAGAFIGLSIYTKVYPLLFIPSLLLFYVYYNWKNEKDIISAKNIGKILLFLGLIFIFTLPVLTHNYLLYKEKGFVDLQFTRSFNLGRNISSDYYGWDAQFVSKNSWKGLILGDTHHVSAGTPLLLAATNYILFGDPLNFILGFVGMFLIIFYRKNFRNYLFFFILSILFILPFLASIILLPKHYIFLEMLLIPMSAMTISLAAKKTPFLSYGKKVGIILIIILAFTLIFLGYPNKHNIEHFYGKSHVAQMIDYKNENIPKDALIVADSRMYRGRIHWAFQDRPYLESIDFINLLSQQEQIEGEDISVEVYFFECIPDDCGWGTIKKQPEFNATMESLVDLMKQSGELKHAISEPIEEEKYFPVISKDNLVEIINVYSMRIFLKDSIVDYAKEPKNWFLYDIGYPRAWEQFDFYEQPIGFFDFLLDKFAHWIVFLAFMLALLSPIYVVYLILDNENAIYNNSSI